VIAPITVFFLDASLVRTPPLIHFLEPFEFDWIMYPTRLLFGIQLVHPSG
jgi:hypothetical protein